MDFKSLESLLLLGLVQLCSSLAHKVTPRAMGTCEAWAWFTCILQIVRHCLKNSKWQHKNYIWCFSKKLYMYAAFEALRSSVSKKAVHRSMPSLTKTNLQLSYFTRSNYPMLFFTSQLNWKPPEQLPIISWKPNLNTSGVTAEGTQHVKTILSLCHTTN